MIIYTGKDYYDVSRKAANIMSAQIIMKPNAVLGLATGSTPVGLYKQLIEHIQSMWRASAMAVEVFEQAQKTDQQERNMQQVRNEPLTYDEPRVKRTGGL